MLYAAFLGTQKGGELLGDSALADVGRAGTAAAIWALASLVSAVLALATVLGSPLAEAIRPAVLQKYAWDIPSVRAYLMAAVLAGVIWGAGRFARSLAAAAAWCVVALAALAMPPLAGHAAGFGNHSLALTSGVAHTWAAAAWGGGLLALFRFGRTVGGDQGLRDAFSARTEGSARKGDLVGQLLAKPTCSAGLLDAEGQWDSDLGPADDMDEQGALELGEALRRRAPSARVGDQPWYAIEAHGGPLWPALAAQLVADACAGLHHAHQLKDKQGKALKEALIKGCELDNPKRPSLIPQTGRVSDNTKEEKT